MSLIAVGILSMVVFRSVIHLGARDDDNLGIDATSLDWLVTTETRYYKNTGNEFLYQTLLLSNTDATGNLGFGYTYVSAVTVHLVPRALWPDKPTLSGAAVIGQKDIQERYGVTIPLGAYPGFAGDLYTNFGYGSLLAWIGIGWMLKRLYAAAACNKGLYSTLLYCFIFVISLNLFMQDFCQGVTFYLFCAAPACLLIWLFTPRQSDQLLRLPDPYATTQIGQLAVGNGGRIPCANAAEWNHP